MRNAPSTLAGDRVQSFGLYDLPVVNCRFLHYSARFVHGARQRLLVAISSHKWVIMHGSMSFGVSAVCCRPRPIHLPLLNDIY